MSEEIKEIAKAAQEVAKFGQVSVAAPQDAGSYFSKYFSETVAELGLTLRDSVAGYRIRNMISVMQKTDKALSEAGINTTFSKISGRNAIPLIEAISSEDNDTLQDIWAKLIANTVTAKDSDGVMTRVLIDTIRRLEPIDVSVINSFFKVEMGRSRLQFYNMNIEEFSPLSLEEVVASLARMSAIGLFTFDSANGMLWASDEEMLLQVGLSTNVGSYRPTYLMIELQMALEPGTQTGRLDAVS